jgi:hypothetical protein
MNLYLTIANPELERLVRQTPPEGGMMFWAGTCSDPGATCGGCKHYGFYEDVRNDAGDRIATPHHPRKCRLYYEHMGKPSKKPLWKGTPACKYFESRKP